MQQQARLCITTPSLERAWLPSAHFPARKCRPMPGQPASVANSPDRGLCTSAASASASACAVTILCSRWWWSTVRPPAVALVSSFDFPIRCSASDAFGSSRWSPDYPPHRRSNGPVSVLQRRCVPITSHPIHLTRSPRSTRPSSRPSTTRTNSQGLDALTDAPGSARPQFPSSQFPSSQLTDGQLTDGQLTDGQLTSTRLFSGPQFSGSGTLLTDHCAMAQYTLIDYGPTASYVPFIGCIDSQPECCPFTPDTSPPPSTPTATIQGIPAVPSTRVYPQPKNVKDAIVNSCPMDYSSISGACCPRYA